MAHGYIICHEVPPAVVQPKSNTRLCVYVLVLILDRRIIPSCLGYYCNSDSGGYILPFSTGTSNVSVFAQLLHAVFTLKILPASQTELDDSGKRDFGKGKGKANCDLQFYEC